MSAHRGQLDALAVVLLTGETLEQDEAYAAAGNRAAVLVCARAAGVGIDARLSAARPGRARDP